MSTHHGGNDGNVPPDGDRSPDPDLPDLPELPKEWGEVAIPDDPSELASEAEQVREELLREKREAAAGPSRPGGTARPGTEPSIGVPLLIMSVAVLITLVSLFAMAWSGTSSISSDPPGAGSNADPPSELPQIVLGDATGRRIALAAQTPIAILLVEECECTQLIAATAAAAPPGVSVAVIGHTPPPVPVSLAPSDPVPLRLADPDGLVRSSLELDQPTDTATVVLVDQDGQITHTQSSATSVAQYQGELTGLAAG